MKAKEISPIVVRAIQIACIGLTIVVKLGTNVSPTPVAKKDTREQDSFMSDFTYNIANSPTHYINAIVSTSTSNSFSPSASASPSQEYINDYS